MIKAKQYSAVWEGSEWEQYSVCVIDYSCVQSVKWMMGNAVQGNMKQSVCCESQYNERATNDGNRTEVHRPDLWQIYMSGKIFLQICSKFAPVSANLFLFLHWIFSSLTELYSSVHVTKIVPLNRLFRIYPTSINRIEIVFVLRSIWMIEALPWSFSVKSSYQSNYTVTVSTVMWTTPFNSHNKEKL